MKVDIEEIRALKARLAEINLVPLEDIQWFENGVEVQIPPETVAEWKFVGLNNADFVMTNAYRDGIVLDYPSR